MLLEKRSTLARLAVAVLVAVAPFAAARAEPSTVVPRDRLRSLLERRIERDPQDGSAWRLLGHWLLEHDDPHEAVEPLRRAVRLEPLSAAARFDLGRALAATERTAEARTHFETVCDLASDSDYGRQALRLLEELPDPVDDESAGVVTVDYRIRRFDASGEVDRILEDDPRDSRLRRLLPAAYGLAVEVGALYDGNVALAPVSRELAPGSRASFQGFVAPQAELRWPVGAQWRAGPAFGGHFTLNEGDFRQFDLQSIRPGAFVERDAWWGSMLLVSRLQYEFVHDSFDGRTFGDRQALIASVTCFEEDDDAWFLAWSVDDSDFADDGVLPSVTSRDGWTNTLTLARDLRWNLRHLQTVRAGVDFTEADTEGTDYRFRGANLFVRAVAPIADGTDLVLDGSVGFRDYFDFQFEPSRNELVWRGGVQLRRQIREDLWIAAVFNYDRFASDNPLFDAERTVCGVVLTYRR